MIVGNATTPGTLDKFKNRLGVAGNDFDIELSDVLDSQDALFALEFPKTWDSTTALHERVLIEICLYTYKDLDTKFNYFLSSALLSIKAQENLANA